MSKVQILGGKPLPATIEISLVDACNRSCEICPRKSPRFAPNNKVYMSIALLYKLRLELVNMDFRGNVVFSGFGEPLLHPQVNQAIHNMEGDWDLELVTNGDLLTRDKIQTMYQAGLDKLYVSIYERKRLPAIKEMLYGFRKERYEIRKRWEPFLVTNRGGIMSEDNKHGPCYYTSYLCMVDWNGDILPCPHDWNRKIKFGNLHDESLYDIWTSERFCIRRSGLIIGRNVSPCNICNCTGTIRGKEHAEAWCEY